MIKKPLLWFAVCLNEQSKTMNSIYVTLNQNIDANILLHKIQNMLSKHGDITNCVMKIEIVKITQDDNSMIPKLEYKELQE